MDTPAGFGMHAGSGTYHTALTGDNDVTYVDWHAEYAGGTPSTAPDCDEVDRDHEIADAVPNTEASTTHTAAEAFDDDILADMLLKVCSKADVEVPQPPRYVSGHKRPAARHTQPTPAAKAASKSIDAVVTQIRDVFDSSVTTLNSVYCSQSVTGTVEDALFSTVAKTHFAPVRRTMQALETGSTYTLRYAMALSLAATAPEKFAGFVKSQNLSIGAFAFGDHTLLHAAAEDGLLSVAKLLLDMSVDVNCRTKKGVTPLHLAALHGHQDVTNFLLKNGANFRAKASMSVDETGGVLPLHAAAASGHVHCARLLLEAGTGVNTVTNAAYSPLYVAAESGQTSMVQFLLRRIADCNIETNVGLTALYVAVANGHRGATASLLHSGRANASVSDKRGNTLLHLAARGTDNDMIKILLAAGLSAFVPNKDGVTPCAVALSQGNGKFVDLFNKSRPKQSASNIP